MTRWLVIAALVLVSAVSSASRGEEQTLDNVISPAPNEKDEPLAAEFSLEMATDFLDRSSLAWTKQRKCFTCHTNYLYLLVRPEISHDVTAHRQVRAALEELVEQRWETHEPRWDAEVVMSAVTLALNDAITTGKLHPTTRAALDRMWTVQRPDGGIDWLLCGWPPMESDDHYGATMMALAVGAAPGEYRQTEAAQQGLAKLRDYFSHNPPQNLHHRATLLWADAYLKDLLRVEQRAETIQRLLLAQKEDGGWNSAMLTDWRRADKKPQDLDSSDGYATGYIIYVLRKAGMAADAPPIQKGIAWLKANQRESGRWYSRSPNKDNKHYLSHAGSAFATLAILSCEPKKPTPQAVGAR